MRGMEGGYYNNKQKMSQLRRPAQPNQTPISICNPTLSPSSTWNRGRSHQIHRTGLMTTTGHFTRCTYLSFLSSVPPVSICIAPAGTHAPRAPEHHLLPRASPTAVTKGSELKFALTLLCSPLITTSRVKISYCATSHLHVPLYGAMW